VLERKDFDQSGKSQINSSYHHTSIFDLDYTLCTVNTSFRFGIFLVYEKFLPLYKMPYLMGCYFCHKIGLMSMSTLHQQACQHLFQGKSIEILAKHVDVFLDSQLDEMLSDEMICRFDDAKSQGHYTVLLSSSPDFIVGEIARRMGFHAWAGTEYSLISDQNIGDVGQLMEGENKAQYVRCLMKEMDLTKDKITAYTDSSLDIPFLEAVGNPVAVNPDKKLRKLSEERNWTII